MTALAFRAAFLFLSCLTVFGQTAPVWRRLLPPGIHSFPAQQARNMDHRGTQFEATRWSLVLRAREGDESQRRVALGALCREYWYPLYAFLRRSGRPVEDAQDLAQEFFVRLMDGRLLETADPAWGEVPHAAAGGLEKSGCQCLGGGQGAEARCRDRGGVAGSDGFQRDR